MLNHIPLKTHAPSPLNRLTANFRPRTSDLRPRFAAPALALFGLITLPSLGLAAAPNVSGTKAAAFPPNNDASARPGDTITYTIGVSNTGSSDATGVQVADTIDPNSTFVNNSAKVSANAIAHAYNAAGNTQLIVNVANGLRNGVTDIDGVTPNASLVVTAGTFVTSAGGSVTIAADGSFTYTPEVGDQNLNDTFSYTVTDGDNLPSTGLVTIALGARVWYVDSTYAGANGTENGSNTRPFNALSDISGASGPDAIGDIIFIIERAGDYDGGLTLLNNQLLYGSGTALTVNTIVINAAGGSNTTMTTTAAATNSITLASGNTVTGFTIGNTTGAKMNGTSFGTLTISNVTMSGTGQALALNTGTVNGTIDSLTTTSSAADGVSLTAIAGTFTITTGAISGATGDEFFVSAGTGVISYGGTISSNGGHAVSVQNKTGGSVTFSGGITATAGSTGINLSANTGATINFSGLLSLTTTTNPAFTATGGGTISATNTGSTITTTTATAVNVANTTISSSNLKFLSITSNTASANSGIVLNTTGNSGGLVVVGNGGTCTSAASCTGGSISNKTTNGISLTNTFGTSLSNMNISTNGNTGGGANGILGTTVTNLSLIGCNISNNGLVAGQDEVNLTDLFGTCAVTNTTINGSGVPGTPSGENNLPCRTTAAR